MICRSCITTLLLNNSAYLADGLEIHPPSHVGVPFPGARIYWSNDERSKILIEVLKLLLSGGFVVLFCYVILSVLRGIAIYVIAKHPELSDNKVKYITQMLSKDGIFRSRRQDI